MEEQIAELTALLLPLIDKYGEETFYQAVEEAINSHPESKANNPLLAWSLLLLHKGYDPDAVTEVAEKSAITSWQQDLEQLI